MKAKAGVALALLVGTAALWASIASARTDGAAAPQTADATSVSCRSAKIGFMGPITGAVAFLGQEQLHWAQFSIARFNKANGTRYKLALGDTQLNPALAQTVGTKLVANSSVVGIVGPAGSQEVLAVGKMFGRAKLAFISASATNATLTNGTNPTFSRVVGGDKAQGRTDANFMVTKLKAKRVFIVDDQEAYSTGLAAAATSVLSAKGVKVDRESVNQKQTDFSALVSKIASDVTVVFLPWQVAANGQLFGQQMREQGKSAKLFGSDGLDSGDFTINGAYVSAFARDIHGLPGTAAVIKAYNAKYGTKWSTFGPPSYVAVQVMATALRASCKDGTVTRSELAAAVRKVHLKKTILGIDIFFDKRGDVPTAKFYIFQIQGTKKVLVG